MQLQTHVLFVSGSLSGGGAERVTSTLLRHLDRSRFVLSLLLMRGNISYPLPEDVRLTVLEDRTRGGTRVDIPLAKQARFKPWKIWTTIDRLGRYLDVIRPDVVVSNIDQVNCATGVALRRASVAPRWIARVGNNPFKAARWLRFWQRRCYKRASVTVTNSSRLADGLQALHQVDRENIQVIGNPTDFSEIEWQASRRNGEEDSSQPPLIVSVGRFCGQKRFDILLDAFARLRRRIDARLCICGDGPLREAFHRDVVRRGLSESISLPGFCDNPYSWMTRAAVFASTSDYEGLPNALIEAQGLGVPAVATRCDYGPDEIIEPEKTGYLVPTGDAAAVAGAIENLLSNPDRRLAMGQAAAARMRQLYDVNKIVGQWHDLLSKN